MQAKKIDNRTDAVVFDFDGTIVNSMEAFADIASEVMPRRHAIDRATARRLYLETSGIPFFEQLEHIFPGDPANALTAEEFERAKAEGYFKEPLFDDAVDTVEYLKGRGLKVAVSSNNFQRLVDEFVERRGLEFDMVMGYRENFAKGRAHFAHITESLGIPCGQITFVGDSLKDAERARACGVPFIGKAGIFRREDFRRRFPDARVISALSELKGIF